MRRVYGIAICMFVVPLSACNGHLPSAMPGTLPAAYGSSRFEPLGTEAILYRFKGMPDGQNPYAGLLAGKNSQFFGTTNGGGTVGPSGFDDGTVFEVSSKGKERVLYSFQGGTDGAGNEAGLIAGKNGVLYGATQAGGGGTDCGMTYGCGTVYELAPKGSGYAEKVLHAFAGGRDGAVPLGDLLLGANGVLYGTTTGGGGSKACTVPSGLSGCGTVFSLTPSGSKWTEKILHAFKGDKDGSSPRDSLIAGSSGTLYGTTEFGGGTSGCPKSPYSSTTCGTVFSLTLAGKETILYRFKGGTDGDDPRAALLAGKNGTFFGLTLYGGSSSICGANGCGTAYELTAKGKTYTEKILYTFGGSSQDGARPLDPDGLAADGSGNLYGSTSQSISSTGAGTIFELAPSGNGYKETVLYAFTLGTSDGEEPFGSVVISKGDIYGTTYVGGGNCGTSSESCGTVYKVTP